MGLVQPRPSFSVNIHQTKGADGRARWGHENNIQCLPPHGAERSICYNQPTLARGAECTTAPAGGRRSCGGESDPDNFRKEKEDGAKCAGKWTGVTDGRRGRGGQQLETVRMVRMPPAAFYRHVT
ncbi:hypothetical protein MAPG_07103 [Magnaporthiopsis poae ATCC 64411]|uniref:Uncharacterized protein n=1 Tax=Magnaporthiopsis poae (strain ATCC 64411 / 73-15) TaxID=644358 RepID=A0A0C4E3T2_MAGP6|nr:hypothetical protein MAPG_07103 [Magnaporthiopsis poae ATCC 64411]